MKKTKSHKKSSPLPLKVTLVVYGVLLLILSAVVAFASIYINGLQEQNHSLADQNFSEMLKKDYRPVEYSRSTDTLLMPALRLEMPYSSFSSSQLRINYHEENSDDEIFAMISTQDTLRVSQFNECMNLYNIIITQKLDETNDDTIFSKRLNNGKYYEIYANNDNCKQELKKMDTKKVLKALKSVQSF